MERRIGRWIAAAASLLLIIVILATCITVYRSEMQERKTLAQRTEYYNEKLTELRAAERELKDQLSAVGTEAQTLSGGTTAGILCTEPDPRILTDILPRLDTLGCAGMVAIKTDALPDDPGCLTLEELTSLIGKGWTVCLSVTDTTDVEALYRTAADFGLSPIAAYFPETHCTPELEQRLAALGITILMQRAPYEAENGTWIQALGSNESGVRNVLLTAISDGKDFVLTVGYRWEQDLFSTSNFDSMLSVLQRYESDVPLRIASADVAVANRQLREEQLAEANRLLAEKRDGIRRSLDAVQQQIREIGQNP